MSNNSVLQLIVDKKVPSIKSFNNEFYYLGCMMCEAITIAIEKLESHNYSTTQSHIKHLTSLRDVWLNLVAKKEHKNQE